MGQGGAREGDGAEADEAVGPPEDADGDGDAQLGRAQELGPDQLLTAIQHRPERQH